MQPASVTESVPVRQDIMPRARPVQPPPTVEMVNHIPVREINQFQPPPSVQMPSSQAPVVHDDSELDHILTEVNKQVAAEDMTPKKKKRFGLGKAKQAPVNIQQIAEAPAIPKRQNFYAVDGAAFFVALILIALAVKIYY